MSFENVRVEILSETVGLNFFYCKPGTYLCFLFFYFLFCFRLNDMSYEIGFKKRFSIEVLNVLKGYQILRAFLKNQKQIEMLFEMN
jgi:hypothetical protein